MKNRIIKLKKENKKLKRKIMDTELKLLIQERENEALKKQLEDIDKSHITEENPFADKQTFKDLRDLMAQIYGEDDEEFKRMEKDGVFE